MQIASRLQVSASWAEINDYLLDKVKPGMKREEVHQILNQYGSWRVFLSDPPGHGVSDPDTKQMVYREIVRFDQFMTRFSLGDWDFDYNKDGILVEFAPVDDY